MLLAPVGSSLLTAHLAEPQTREEAPSAPAVWSSLSTANLAARRSSDNGGVEANAVSAAAHAPYPRTGPPRHTPCTFGAWDMDLENQNYRQRLDENQNLLRPRVQLNEYYNFGRIEPGRPGCFFGLENGHLSASNHHFLPLRGVGEGCALWGARKSSLTWGGGHGGGAPKTPISYGKLAEIRIFTVFAPCDAHAGWPADP